MEFFSALNVWQKRAITGVLGATAGYAYYYYIGCMSGTCPITSNPYISTLYGTVVGILLISGKKKTQKENNGNNSTTTPGEKI
ncbi:MAG: hypothetical protein HYV29_11240 [Ignavibacteriales bacterium]|nr:hypothetical protein [Ignavibacteriales bacterium]